MSFALSLVLAGCSGLSTDGSPPTSTPEDPAVPSLTILTPDAGSNTTALSASVLGSSVLLDTITVNGEPATLSEHEWNATVPLTTGLNTFEVVGSNEEVSLRDIRSIVAGDVQAASGAVEDAVHLQIGADVLADLSPLVQGLLDPAALQAQLAAMNPVLDTGDMTVNIGALDFGEVDLSLLPGNGVLEIDVVVNNLSLELGVTGAPLGIDAAEVTVDAVYLTMGIELGTDGAGNLTATLLDPSVSFDDFDFDLDNWLINLFISDSDIEELLLEEVDGILLGLQPSIDEVLAGLELNQELELLGTTFAIEPSFASATVTPDGISIGLDLVADALGVSADGDHLVVGSEAPVPVQGMGVQLSDDFMNRFLYEIWATGALDLELPIEAGDVATLLLQQMGGIQGVGGSLGLQANLAPVFVARGDTSRLQLGEVLLTVQTPGGAYGDTLEFKMALDAKATFAIAGDSAGIQISDAQVLLVPLGEAANHAALLEKMPQVQSTLGLGLGALNDLLTFPLGDEPLELPELAIERGERSTRIGLDAGAIYTLITGEQPPPPPHPLDPQGDPVSQNIPVDVDVFSDDTTDATDNISAWVCGRDEVVTTGSDGHWFLERRAELTVQGSGHVIYAERQAEIVLEGPGNIVIADPDATVTDVDGSNLVFIAASVDLDGDAVPDGC